MSATDNAIRQRQQEVNSELARKQAFRGHKKTGESRSVVSARPHRKWSSRQLHLLGSIASHAWAGVVVFLLTTGWVIYGALAGFPSYWQAALESVTSVVTVVMLFAIQHLQARHQTVVQRKLDEILRAMPNTDPQVIALETAADEELDALTALNHSDRLPDEEMAAGHLVSDDPATGNPTETDPQT